MEESAENLLAMKTTTNENNNTLEIQKFDHCDCEKSLEKRSQVVSNTKTRVLCIILVILIFALLSVITAIVVHKLSGGGKEKMGARNETSAISTTITVVNTSLSSTTSTSTHISTTSTSSTVSTTTACKSSDFTCSDGTCVKAANVCDGKPHCPLAEDETENCECSSLQFRCDSGQCVEASSRCDGFPQCFDKSDEMNCSNCIGFQCSSGLCLWTDSVKCNFHVDCPDLSDEMNCERPRDHMRCGNGLLVHIDKVCDGVDDCFDNTDEDKCGMICKNDNNSARISCADRSMCIMRDWLCDGYVDCTDGSDERDCGECKSDEAQCSDYKCIPTQQVCDGIKQCEAGDDEVDCLRLSKSNVTDSPGIVTVKSDDLFLPVCSHGWTSDAADQICKYFGYRSSSRSQEIDGTRAGVTLSNGFMVFNDNFRHLSSKQSLLAKFVKMSTCPGNKVIGVECHQNVCGERKVDILTPFIVGGTLVPAGKWPWVVSITRLGEGWCGGVIVNQHWVLTSAHCIVTSTNYSLTPHFFKVTAGTVLRQRQIGGHSQKSLVDQIVLHPQMKQFETGITDWDLALLHLKSPLSYGDYVQPICFPEEDETFPTQSQCYLAGWGFINTQEVSVNHLREGKMMLWTDSNCAADGISSPLNTNSTVCAGYNNGAISACKGDSGSPLMCSDERGRWTVVGVMSHGVNGCHGKSLRRVNRYAKVSTSIKWIQMTTGG